MKEVKLIRNIGLFGHSKCGKTTLAEALLFTAGTISRIGQVDNGTSHMDFEAEEISHRMSINTAFHHLPWNKHEVYLSDTPGDENFLNDAMFTAQVVDGAIFTIGAVLGIKTQTEKIAGYVLANHIPTLIFINKMNRERADFARTVADITANLAFKPAVIQLPIGAEV